MIKIKDRDYFIKAIQKKRVESYKEPYPIEDYEDDVFLGEALKKIGLSPEFLSYIDTVVAVNEIETFALHAREYSILYETEAFKEILADRVTIKDYELIKHKGKNYYIEVGA